MKLEVGHGARAVYVKVQAGGDEADSRRRGDSKLAMAYRRTLQVISALVIGLVALTLPTAQAQDQDLPPIYFGATQAPDGQTVVKFVFSKRSTGKQQFEPTHAFRISPNQEQHKCNTERTDDFRIPEEDSKRPSYDSADPKSKLRVGDLPVFFAIMVSAKLAQKGLAKTEEDSLPYHTCTRLLWEQLLGLRRGQK